MRRILATFLLLLLLPGLALADTTDQKTGSQTNFLVPLYNPAGGFSPTNPAYYGSYPLSDVFSLITPVLIGALPDSTVLPSSKVCSAGNHVSEFDATTGTFTCSADTGAGGTTVNSHDCGAGYFMQSFDSGTGDFTCAAEAASDPAGTAAAAVSAHEAAIDPHSQYFNQSRGDAGTRCLGTLILLPTLPACRPPWTSRLIPPPCRLRSPI